MMNKNKEVCGCCHAEYFVDENNNWQLVETRRIADLEAENEQLHRQYEGQRTAARVNWDKVKALEAELAALKEWLYSVAWSNCDCTTLSNSAEYDPRKHEETCEYRTITMNVHMPDPAPYPEDE